MKFSVSKNNNGERVDIYLSQKIERFSRSFIKKLILERKVTLNKKIVTSPATKIKSDDIVIIEFILNRKIKLIPKKINLDIIFEDKDLLIINKPKGLIVHPGAGNYENTLANALVYKYKKNLSNIFIFYISLRHRSNC